MWHEGPLTDGTSTVLELNQAGDPAEHTMLLGSLIAHTNGAVRPERRST